jgi:hypothetical protein
LAYNSDEKVSPRNENLNLLFQIIFLNFYTCIYIYLKKLMVETKFYCSWAGGAVLIARTDKGPVNCRKICFKREKGKVFVGLKTCVWNMESRLFEIRHTEWAENHKDRQYCQVCRSGCWTKFFVCILFCTGNRKCNWYAGTITVNSELDSASNDIYFLNMHLFPW